MIGRLIANLLFEEVYVANGEDLDRKQEAEETGPFKIPSYIFCKIATMATTTGRQSGAGNYTSEEVRHLLDVMESILPIGGEEWDQVVDQHATSFAGRDVNSIRRKYSTLHRKQIPTGDPNMPPEVRQAKRIKYMIGRKADLGDGEEIYQLQQNAFAARDRERGTTQEEEFDGAAAGTVPTVPPLGEPSQEEEEEEAESTTAVTPAKSRARDAATVSSSSTRAYRKAAGHDQFLEMMRLQIQQEASARESDRVSREADRQLFRDGLNAMMTGMTAYLSTQVRGRKRKRKAQTAPESSSSSDSE